MAPSSDSSAPRLRISTESLYQKLPTLAEVLDNTAHYPYTLESFVEYLSQNHCSEALEFLVETDHYKKTYYASRQPHDESNLFLSDSELEQLMVLWRQLLALYISNGSPREINVTGEDRQRLIELTNATSPPSPRLIDPIVQSTYDLLETSIFIQFLASRASSSPTLPSTRKLHLAKDQFGLSSLDDVTAQFMMEGQHMRCSSVPPDSSRRISGASFNPDFHPPFSGTSITFKDERTIPSHVGLTSGSAPDSLQGPNRADIPLSRRSSHSSKSRVRGWWRIGVNLFR
ncbi:regulator of G protein signaling superfamily [Aspergillus heteromorphus CBS 117.55]|uniref:Regulator of G protein signaling superfamily n=1 Tax=Aspergillus heteromorphus CBS 117.55 TaxID=1448321 RepID=A0A317WRY8_9EURO|nr:regulator of G protein signaling superfamily [Aspergillus heteromorphus CBS 117.55]PWY89223.1 regulator of G protein signaling superfamily [Aspergillus heteromorphus CBS 117.55]